MGIVSSKQICLAGSNTERMLHDGVKIHTHTQIQKPVLQIKHRAHNKRNNQHSMSIFVENPWVRQVCTVQV